MTGWCSGVVGLVGCCGLSGAVGLVGVLVSGVKGSLDLNGLARLLVSAAGWSMELLVSGVKRSL